MLLLQVQQQVPPLIHPEFQSYIEYLIKDHIGVVVLFMILLIVAIVSAQNIISKFFNIIFNKFLKNNEYIEFGKLKIKNKIGNVSPETDGRIIDISSFVNMIDILLSNEIENVITKTIEITNSVHQIESSFNVSCENIFRSTFASLRTTYHTELMGYIAEVTNFNVENIHSTREYFFIDDLLNDSEKLWMEMSKDIIDRNGFINIIDDIKLAKPYIDELYDCVNRSIDMRKLESTAFDKKKLDEIFSNLQIITTPILEKMFIRIGNLKKSMTEKKDEKLNVINNDIKHSVNRVVKDVEQKFLQLATPNSAIENKDEK